METKMPKGAIFLLVVFGVLMATYVFTVPTDSSRNAQYFAQIITFCMNPVAVGVAAAILFGIAFWPNRR